jgi:uncharacterized glyoxalase superfamily protein PhnB
MDGYIPPLGLIDEHPRPLAMSSSQLPSPRPSKDTSTGDQAMQKIVPSLWFDNQAEEAANFYVSIFGASRIVNVARYGSAGPGPDGSVMAVDFQLQGQDFNAINGGPQFKFIDLAQLRRAYAITPQRPGDVGRVSEPLREVDRSAEAATEDGGEPGDLLLQCLAR